jgi:hypothetical protein
MEHMDTPASDINRRFNFARRTDVSRSLTDLLPGCHRQTIGFGINCCDFPRHCQGKRVWCFNHRSCLASAGDESLRFRLNAAVTMSNTQKFDLREWLVPPILLPLLFGLVIAGAVVIQWRPPPVAP